ncbi:MAG: type IX secretion system outer membrane channel protein PorV [Chloroherpetonaceae bacterium]|nr:type IX secretion system outer membrane channel protein PorV [Chloroherpetonaceae bacterium]MCS7210914.1 type IX secretion system outer membrane channel protein PorV [Chloroherpetonaceae bacterium]MDW8019740.1 type IX secretion system outer membrane channel protein PorV [Chloroherpetonaceae bacterium]
MNTSRTFSPLLRATWAMLFCIATNAFAQSSTPTTVVTTAVPFLLISPDSRAAGMGDANVAIADNASAVFWNPAGLGFQKGLDVNLTYSNWLPAFNADLFYNFLTGKYYVPGWGTFGLSVIYLNLGESRITNAQGEDLGAFRSYEFAIGLHYGVKVTPDLSLGTSIRYINSSLSPANVQVGNERSAGQGNSVSFDVAALWRPQLGGWLSDRLSFGLNISNIGPAMTYVDAAQADPLPTNFRAGLAFRLLNDDYNKMTIAADFSRLLVRRTVEFVQRGDTTVPVVKTDNVFQALITSWGAEALLRTFTTGVGVEYWYGKPSLLALRAGYFHEDQRAGGRQFLTFGAGLRYSSFGVDFSYLQAIEQNHPLAGTVRLSLVLNFPTLGVSRQ